MSARNSLKHFHVCCLLLARSAPLFLPRHPPSGPLLGTRSHAPDVTETEKQPGARLGQFSPTLKPKAQGSQAGKGERSPPKVTGVGWREPLHLGAATLPLQAAPQLQVSPSSNRSLGISSTLTAQRGIGFPPMFALCWFEQCSVWQSCAGSPAAPMNTSTPASHSLQDRDPHRALHSPHAASTGAAQPQQVSQARQSYERRRAAPLPKRVLAPWQGTPLF